MDEREFFNETEENRPATLNCPFCRQVDSYDLRWVIRRKRSAPPPRANEQERAKFAALKPYMVRKDDLVMCKNQRCRKRFEVSGVQSVAFLTADGQIPPAGPEQEPASPEPPKPQAPKFKSRLMRQH